MNECCYEHSGHASRIKSAEEDIRIVAQNTNSAHRRIDGMKNWVIAGMSSLVMQLLIMIIGLILYYVRTKPGA